MQISYLIVQIAETSSKISQLRCCDEVVVEILYHYARKLDILVLHDTVCHGAVDLLGTERQAQLSNDEIASSLQQSSIRAKQLQEINHERCEVRVVAMHGDL